MADNGKVTFNVEGMSLNEVLSVIIDGLTQLAEQQEAIVETQKEIVEKIENLNLENEGFGYDD